MDKKNHPIRILLAEDVPTDAELVKREISKMFPHRTFQVVETRDDFIDSLKTFVPDLVVSDFRMPTFDGMSALQITVEQTPEIPLIIVTGSINEETAVSCLKAGAVDYVLKDSLKRLGQAVLNALEQKEAIKQKHIAENLLKESEEKYRSLIENSGDAIYLLYNRKFEIINPRFEQLFGYTFDEVNHPEFDFIRLVAPESRNYIEERTIKIKAGEKLNSTYEFKAITKSNELKEVEVSVSYIHFKGGIATQGIIRDISERMKMIEELIAAKERAEESDRLKSAFLANMSHEIRTPMNGILGFANLLKEPHLTGDEKDHFINIIESSGQRMLTTINDLVDIAKIESGMVEIMYSEILVNDQLQALYYFFQSEALKKGLRFIYRSNPDLIGTSILSDREMLNAILNNLIKNAIKYTQVGNIEFGFKIENGNILFYVNDSGIGIEKSRHLAIFDRFVQEDNSISRSYEGAGLGLSISKAYVEMLGGRIWVESEKGQGAKFYFTIPSKKIESAIINSPVKLVKSKENDILGKLTVLVAEDDEVGRLFLSAILEKKCKKIYFVENGIEAIKYAQDYGDEIDLVLMDLKMPLMDGFSAAKKIKSINPNIFIIAQTAFAMSNDKDKALESGCDTYITKPINKEYLIRLIKDHFKGIIL
jgi:PAS domain S-box-containing protein